MSGLTTYLKIASLPLTWPMQVGAYVGNKVGSIIKPNNADLNLKPTTYSTATGVLKKTEDIMLAPIKAMQKQVTTIKTLLFIIVAIVILAYIKELRKIFNWG